MYVHPLEDGLACRECVGVGKKATRDVRKACDVADHGRDRVDRLYAAIYQATSEVLPVFQSIRGRTLDADMLKKVKDSTRTCAIMMEAGVIAFLDECRRTKQCDPFAGRDVRDWLAGARMPVVICEWIHHVRGDFDPIRRFCDEYLLPGYRVLMSVAVIISEMVCTRICVLIVCRRPVNLRTRGGGRVYGARVLTDVSYVCVLRGGVYIQINGVICAHPTRVSVMAGILPLVVITLILVALFGFGPGTTGFGFLICLAVGFTVIDYCIPNPVIVVHSVDSLPAKTDIIPPPSSA